MPLIFQAFIVRAELFANPDKLYVFGDNLARFGYGGQAAQMRGARNAVGLPTKRTPAQFLQDSDLAEVQAAAKLDIALLTKHLTASGIVIWPKDGIGTGLAQLAEKAPLVAKWYEQVLTNFQEIK